MRPAIPGQFKNGQSDDNFIVLMANSNLPTQNHPQKPTRIRSLYKQLAEIDQVKSSRPLS